MQHTPPFLLGANLPWLHYGIDFGANAWQPRGGFRVRGDARRLRAIVDELVAQGVSALRWFVLCDGRAGIRFDADGTPFGLDDACLDDLDAGLAVVRDAGARVMPVLLDFHWCRPARVVHGVTLGGHARTIRDPRRRAALLDRVIAPIVARFGREPAVLAWDVMNEPEWVTFGLGSWHPRAVRVHEMRAFLREATELVHATASGPVTVGSASTRWLSLVRDIGLDVYQPHWYDSVDRRSPLATPVADLELDRPAWLGEFPTRGSRRPPDALLAAARRAGYAGAWFWSVTAHDRHTDYPGSMLALSRWREAAGDRAES